MGSFATIAQTRRNAQASTARAVPDRAPPESYRPSAAFFCQLRQYLGLTREQVATYLQTYPTVIAALETGALADLPPWTQTRVIVWNYATLAGIDPAPALHSLEVHLAPSALVPVPPDIEQGDEASARPANVLKIMSAWMPRRWPILRILTVSALLMVAGLFSQTSVLEAAVSKLPAPLGGFVRYAKEALLVTTSRKFEGMTWIDVDNPRTRRADKLPMKRR